MPRLDFCTIHVSNEMQLTQMADYPSLSSSRVICCQFPGCMKATGVAIWRM